MFQPFPTRFPPPPWNQTLGRHTTTCNDVYQEFNRGTSLELSVGRFAEADSRLVHVHRLGKPLTLTEKILYAHLANPEQELVPGSSQLELQPQVRMNGNLDRFF